MLVGAGDEAGAEMLARKLTRRHPGSAVAWNAWGGMLGQLRQYTKAVTALERAAALDPSNPSVHNNLGNILATLGSISEALARFRAALSLRPAYPECWSNLLFARQADGRVEPDGERSDALAFAAQARAGVTPYTAWQAKAPGDPLRIGLVSGDLREHPVGYFLDGVCAHLERHGLSLLAFPTQRAADALSQRLRSHCAAWVPLQGLADAAAAARIHDHAPQVLIDLSGHTALNRLPIFAWRPAPVQVSWLGYVSTTGLSEVDYLLADPLTVPPGAEGPFVERIWRLPETRFCFTPPPECPPVAPLPASGSGFLTFGCYNRLCKIQEPVLALWARVLRALPDSRLRIMTRELSDPGARTLLQRRLTAAGLDARRVVLDAPRPRADYLAAYGLIDVVLDTFPFSGGTTTAEALWMGVPVLALEGQRLVERQAGALLRAAGLAQWVAADADDFVAKAVRLGEDLPALAALRGGLREQARASAVCDAKRFAASFAAAMHDMVRAAG